MHSPSNVRNDLAFKSQPENLSGARRELNNELTSLVGTGTCNNDVMAS
jgi:hypothetical protein